ncbi:copper-exporting ATPase / responsive-to-antagonist 1 / copper-transporting ATPase (RAN1) [Artemisia annua]|uniref:Copper-exporting ATPase / responsive-to-antagonist 1 / copper-transporting ATPase (RAN1) n=1 Tax=Artemisia annua TaxID=35608 RepID=A0A2U1N8A2_ARTAN|nr:copper-exporting ATPase / responsive-to-antagonist 1 / copper-transporting ATPase (RAN1) [Artemisia annua]
MTQQENVAIVTVDALLIQPGNVLKALPGKMVHVDGHVVWHSSHVNGSMVTGEYAHAVKDVDSLVIGVVINFNDLLHVQATKIGSDTILSHIISLVETAQMSKAPIENFADYVSFIMAVSFLKEVNSEKDKWTICEIAIDMAEQGDFVVTMETYRVFFTGFADVYFWLQMHKDLDQVLHSIGKFGKTDTMMKDLLVAGNWRKYLEHVMEYTEDYGVHPSFKCVKVYLPLLSGN